MIESLEASGLGYYVRADQTEDTLGSIPMRHLVYRVQPLPPSMLPLVWDFGQLNVDVEKQYILQIVQRFLNAEDGDTETIEVISNIISASQTFMRKTRNECSFVSLRDVERTMNVMVWFLEKLEYLNPLIEDIKMKSDHPSYETPSMLTRALTLSLGVCYHARLQDQRRAYRIEVAQYFVAPCALPGGEQQMVLEMIRCQDVFLNHIELGPNIARNTALRENVFMMIVCLELRIPLFLVGKPGSSKSLAKTIVADAMQGISSKNEFFKKLKQVRMVSYQCSPLSTPEGIISVFRRCGKLQKQQELDNFVSVVVLDELGLAEDSPAMPLKTLHPLLEYGAEEDNTSQAHMRVGFIGISNWALDPAKMNRGILVSRPDLDEEELKESAIGICHSDNGVLCRIQGLLSSLAAAYLKVCEKQTRQFFGLRDFYSLIKMVFALTKISANPPSWGQLEHAVRRNFGGLDEIDIVEIFKDTLKSTYVTEEHDKNDPDCSTAGLIKASLEVDKSIYIGESRYLLLLTENYAALGILQQILNWNDHVIIFGSSFPKDQEYTQICRNIHRIKTCMETGRNVVLLNLENLYESLYDALNQYYVYFGDNRYIDIGLGVLRRKCRVHKDFKLVVIAERQVVYEKFPIPLINRLEKHFLAMASILTAQQHAVVARLEQWADEFANFSLAGPGGRRIKFSIPDAFIGYNQDTPASIVLRLSSDTKKEKKDEKVWTSQVLEEAKRVLLQCATPDAVARLNKSKLGPLSNQIWNQYFHEQHHDSIVSYLKLLMGSGQFKEDTLTQITTHSRLLSRHDTDQMSTELGSDSITVVSLHEFQTEQQFSRKARDFFNTVTAKIKILVIQCSSGNEHTNLIACSRYLIQDERVKAEKRKLKAGAGGLMTAHVVFIIQLPRIVGGCFAGFQGGKWNSIHIDELRPAEARLPEITDFENHSISKMFQIGMESKHKSLTRESDHSGGHERAQERKFVLDTYYVINSCLQTALSMLVDSEDNAHRASERVDLLLKLCKQKGKSLYWNVLQERIYDLLRQKDERGVDIKAWLCNEATSGQSMQENGTFRRALLHKLLRTITHILAEVIAFTDVNDNLSIIENNGEPAWVKTMWFTILGNTGIAPLEYTSFLSPLDVPREHIPVRSTGIGGSKFRCRCPFSWIIKERLDEMWNSEMHKHEVYYEVVRNSDLGTYLQEIIPEAMVSDFSNLYLHDFVRMVYRASQLGEYELIMDEIEVVAKQIHRDMNAYDETHVDFILTPPAIHMAWYKMRLRFESFAQTLVIIPQALQQLNVLERFEEMTIDVYTLTYLLEVLQPDEHDIRDTTARSQWLRKVKESRPLIDKILAMAESYNEKDEITNIYGGKSKRDLGIARTMWNRITVLQLFVEHVCVPSLGFKELNIEHTILLKRMLNSDDKVDFKTLDTLAILETFLNRCVDDVSAKLLKYGIRVCAVCKEAIKDPVLFPCHHIFCLQCVEILLSNGGGACATCRQKLPLYFQPEVSQDIVDAIEKLSEHRRQFNGFFMEIVSRLCFMGNLPPHSDVIERMLTYVSKNTRENENIRSKRMSALVEDCIDPTPVLRSFLLQLILKFRKDHVYDHLSDFLQVNLQFCVDEQDVIELCLLFTQCLEDSYYQEDHHNRTGIIEIALAKLKSGIRPKSVRPSALNISRLEKIAAARFSLTLTAELIYHYFGGSQDQNESKQRREHIQFTEAMKLIDMAKTYCDRIGNKWPRLYLLKQLCRRYGRDVTRSVSGIDRFKWIAPDLLVKHDDVPDRFLVYGDNYESIIDALELSLHQEDLDRDKDILSIKNDKLKEALLLSAMYRILVMLCVTNDGNSNEQEMDNLQKILGNLGANKDVIETIISNTVNGEETFLQVVPKQGGLTRTIAAIVTHVQIMVLYSPRSNLLEPFDFLANHPEVMKGSYLPTMPDDMIMEAREALHAEGLHWFECKNGHPYTIGECGGPRAIGKCSDCGVNIGGIDYKFERGADKEARITDSTQTGHVLGEPTKRSRKSNTERLMSPAATAIIRLLMHSALMVAATKNPKDLEGIFHPKMPSDDVRKFVWHHIECDLVQISHAIGRSVDDAAVTVHMILKRMVLKQATGACQFDARLSSKDDRQLWEELFAKKFVNPSIENLGNRLNEANVKIYSDERMGNCQLLKLLYEVDIDPVKHSLEQLHTVPAMWRYRSRITIQHLSQVVQGCIDTFPVLQHFLKAEHNLRALQYLPDIVRLQQQLFDRYHRNIDESEAIAIRIDRFLESLPVQEQEEHARLISSFCKAWEILRGKIAVSGRLQVSNDMCTRDITTSSNLAVLLPTRKGDGICSTALLDMLIVVHNTFMEEYSNLTDNTLGGYIRPQDATVAHLVAYDTDRDLLPVVISNCTYSLEIQNGQEVQTEYDLMSLEKQLDECFIYGRPLLQHEIPRLVFRQDCKDAIILDKLRRRIPQVFANKQYSYF
ncbi:E3 ubiquitin-protein ligase rnf213-alpha-like [Saccoglossus kowalevskii]